MQAHSITHILVASLVSVSAGLAQAASIDLAGPDGSGTLSLSNVKGWASAEAALEGLPNFAYFFNENSGVWTSIVALPLSADAVYAEEATVTVFNKTVTAADYATFSAGTIEFDDSALTGSGTETISAGTLGFTFNDAGFSPLGSSYNSGSGYGNAGWSYTITASNVSGTGLTFTDGVLSSIDLTADISVTVLFAGMLPFTNTYDGQLTISGDQYAFDLDVTQDNVEPFFVGAVSDTRMVFNRAGSIAAVTAVPEPSTYALMAAGLALVGGIARRGRRA